jgi:hypothetical protein
MSNSNNSAAVALLRKPAQYMRRLFIGTVLCLVIMIAALGGRASRAGSNEDEARAFFTKFIEAQNAHNVDEVKTMLWDSPSMLWFGRNVEIRGRDAVADRFKEYYKGTWHLKPDMSQFHVAAISSDVSQILVPIVFTRGLPGDAPQENTFLISQTFVRDAAGWHVASIMPIANTQLK